MPSVAALSPATTPQPAVQSGPVTHHASFHDALSMLNPLQYLPVIGTIYRAVTGDQIPEAARRIGSFIVSTLLGGPVGAAINVAMMVGEKLTGIDLDKTGQKLLAGNATVAHTPGQAAPGQAAPGQTPTGQTPTGQTPTGQTAPDHADPHHADPDHTARTALDQVSPEKAAPSPPTAPAPATVTRDETPRTAPVPHAWSSAQLAAYGVTTSNGVLQRADRSGADVLNTLELLRIRGAQAAYGRVASVAG